MVALKLSILEYKSSSFFLKIMTNLAFSMMYRHSSSKAIHTSVPNNDIQCIVCVPPSIPLSTLNQQVKHSKGIDGGTHLCYTYSDCLYYKARSKLVIIFFIEAMPFSSEKVLFSMKTSNI